MKNFYRGRKVLITGHTGFKGSWLCSVLLQMQADVVGVSLNPPSYPYMFDILSLVDKMKSITCDIRNLEQLLKIFEDEQPEIVIHMAAQPLVLESYQNPVYTYDVNVMGTVNVLECIRKTSSVKSFINVTTDKVYQNEEKDYGYKEDDRLNGYDPYSNSKSCSELVSECYKKSFFSDKTVAISTCRAGNVIGGGDFAKDRIIPDCVRAAVKNDTIIVRNQYSIRPYQHVLEPIMFYLDLAMKQYQDNDLASNYNIGPDDANCVMTGEIVTLFCKYWQGTNWKQLSKEQPHEANYLKLDSTKAKKYLNYKPRWSIEQAIEKTVSWSKAYYQGEDMFDYTNSQIKEFTSQNE